ncbi:MAG: carboxylesterase family protein [Lachnospiraceae bacterium]|nr:carboxylesterase family protein [Lachnospiraceae bacterium]
MKTNSEKKRSRGILWRILFFLLLLILFAVLELGKHTILGWILLVLVFAAFYVFRSTKLKEKSKGIRFLSWIALLILCGIVLWISWPPVRLIPAVQAKNPAKTDLIHVTQGDLTGVVTEDKEVEVFAGIPYAKPPVGDLRWKEPQSADAWEGILEADHFAPMSMQVQNLPIYNSLAQIIGYHDYQISLKDNYREPVSEDSLYLNIWRPAQKTDQALPVLVYIHGGSLQTGQPWYQDYSGEGLARKGIIVVNMAYRLGIFGFYADPALAEESPNHTTGNYGLLDQILALQWVKDNIAAFGGDPENITISGESAGSACVSALCTSPLAKGLFKRVILESSTVSAPKPAHSFRLLDEAYETAEQMKDRLHAHSLKDLRALPAGKIVREMAIHHHITIDGFVLPEIPYESYQKGIYNEEAQLQGFNREEGAPFIIFSPANMKNYEQKIRASFEDPYADQILSLFPAQTDAEAKRNWADIYTAVLFTYGQYCLGREAVANEIPCYMYHFTKENGRLGSWHSGEEVYFYHNIPDGSALYTEEDRALSDMVSSYMINFIKNGDPNGDGLPRWNTFAGTEPVLELGDNVKETKIPYLDLYEILDQIQEYK